MSTQLFIFSRST